MGWLIKIDQVQIEVECGCLQKSIMVEHSRTQSNESWTWSNMSIKVVHHCGGTLRIWQKLDLVHKMNTTNFTSSPCISFEPLPFFKAVILLEWNLGMIMLINFSKFWRGGWGWNQNFGNNLWNLILTPMKESLVQCQR